MIRYLFLLLTCLTAAPAFSQGYHFIYDFHWVKYDCRPDESVSGKTILMVNDTLSAYLDYSRVSTATRPDAPGSRRNMLFDYTVYKNSGRLRFQQPIHGTPYYYDEPIPEIDWEIREDTTRILGYLCQKALGSYSGRNYEAWFSMEIPVSNGPDKFGGLPGLILRLEDSEGKIRLELSGVETHEKVEFKNYAYGKAVSKKQFKDREEDYYVNYKQYAGSVFNNSNTYVIRGRQVTVDELFEDMKSDFFCRVNID